MRAHLMSGGRYPVLRSLGILSMVSAGLIAVGSLATAVWGLFTVTDTFAGRVIWFAASVAAGFILTVWMLAFAEMLKLLIDLEHNTRMQHLNNGGPAEKRDGALTPTNRISALDEETAEAALLRGH